jgi:hypothetical protein
MTIYIAQDGSYGDEYDLVLIDDASWKDEDYALMAEWNERTRNEYAIYCQRDTPYLTPTEWEKQ